MKERKTKFTEDELWEVAIKVADELKFSLRKGKIWATLDGKAFNTGINPKKLSRRYLSNIDKYLSYYMDENVYDSKEKYIEKFISENVDQYTEKYIEKFDTIYKWALDRIVEEESGILSLVDTLKDNQDNLTDFSSALKIIKNNLKDILEYEILSDIDASLEHDREYLYKKRYFENAEFM